MVTREQLEQFLDAEDNNPFSTEIDHHVRVITLLRERIPYEKCSSIISGAEHDQVYLCAVELAEEYLAEEDLAVLADCNCFLDEDIECLSLFV